MALQHDELVRRVEEALGKGIQDGLDVHELAVLVVDHVRQPQPVNHLDRRQIIAERLNEI